MIHICTTGDINYLNKGICLLQSLVETIRTPFVLHWLCFDKETHEVVKQSPHVIPYLLEDLEKENSELIAAKEIPAREYGNQYSQYCWCLTPYFINYILKQKVIGAGDKLLYCDNDIYFYHSPEIILDAMGAKSVAIHTQRFGGAYDDNNPVGWYNVGVMAFKKDETGMDISEKWKGWLLNPSNEYAEKYGTCGDQKYLNLFIPLWGKEKVCVFDEDNGIVHLAPWCTHNPDNRPVLFYHFSHFRCDDNTWYDSLHGEWNPSREPEIKKLYEEYYQIICQLLKL